MVIHIRASSIQRYGIIAHGVTAVSILVTFHISHIRSHIISDMHIPLLSRIFVATPDYTLLKRRRPIPERRQVKYSDDLLRSV